MLEQVLREIKNWFQIGIYPGNYTIESGGITLPFLLDGQYFRIIGSIFNDGLHQYGQEMPNLIDEEFSGTIWALAIPKAVQDIASEIDTWQSKYKDTVESPYTSESFGGYSYSKASGAGDSGEAAGWQSAFRSRLNQWRKLREI